MNSDKFYYQCVDCGKKLKAGEVQYLCPDCSRHNDMSHPPKGVLKLIYPYDDIRKKRVSFSQIKAHAFLDLLPIKNVESFPTLKTGNTPLYPLLSLDGKNISAKAFIKDDSQNPTYSFKDRASNLVSAFAKENRINTIVAASTGNAGSSLAGICASQQQKAIIMVPEKAPLAKLTQILMYGATIIPVKGTYDEAFDLSIEATKEFGWYNRNTAFNPLTIEGKKTVSYELFDQLHEHAPDRIFVPVGDGVIISGVYKGFEDLLRLGFIDKMPIIVAVQSEGSNNLISNLDRDEFLMKPSHTLADSIAVDIPRNFYMAKQFILKYQGEGLEVSDEAILDASSRLSKNTGLFAEPAAATAFAGFLNYLKNHKLPSGSVNVILSTGSGLKDLQAVQKIISIPKAIEPNLSQLKKLLS